MKLGVQLYSIKDISEKDGLAAAMKKAHELGYDCIEFAGYYGLDADEISALLKEYNLETAGIHSGVDALRGDFDATLDFAKKIGAYSYCIPWYNCETADGWVEFAKEINEYGKKFREAGILLGYHNHAHEFKEIDGKRPIDLILENTDAENVFFEMDTHHVVNGGCSPIEYAEKYRDRIPVIHVKENKGGNDTTVGTGDIDFPAVFRNAGKINYYIVENENHGTNIKELEDSAVYLKSIL